MSGLAEVMMSFNYKVSGSDIKESLVTKKLKTKGIRVYIGHHENNIKNSDLVIYTAAIKNSNPEFIRAKKSGIPLIERSLLLGELSKKFKNSIAITGTHGKTTTSSMITRILIEASLNPTAHIGGFLDFLNGSVKIGGPEYFVTEACEYRESFLTINPYIGVILNIENEHPDYFKDLRHVKNTFTKFIHSIKNDGYLVACIDDKNFCSILNEHSFDVTTFGVNSKADCTANNINYNNMGYAKFDVVYKGKYFCDVQLSVPGIHNVTNALGAIVVANLLGCSKESIVNGLAKFYGVKRRFEHKGIKNKITVIDDFAHHPTEIKATLSAARIYFKNKIWCVFQPHTYSRTKKFMEEFSQSFSQVDFVVVHDIYVAREESVGYTHSKLLVEKIRGNGTPCIYLSDFKSIVEYLNNNVSSNELIITMGAGDIYKVGEKFLQD